MALNSAISSVRCTDYPKAFSSPFDAFGYETNLSVVVCQYLHISLLIVVRCIWVFSFTGFSFEESQPQEIPRDPQSLNVPRKAHGWFTLTLENKSRNFGVRGKLSSPGIYAEKKVLLFHPSSLTQDPISSPSISPCIVPKPVGVYIIGNQIKNQLYF